ncbi:MAG: KH domain-containing protein [Bacilli bacterium]|jgi:predicted RNA-binding protein YlqC (UPF0109 family)|nr:KH domain-containing protein [Bacilli bacterium]
MDLVLYSEFVIKNICKNPNVVKVKSTQEDSVTILEVMVSEADMGSVIGKAGRVAQSLRVLIQAYAYLHDLGKVRINIESF